MEVWVERKGFSFLEKLRILIFLEFGDVDG
jgi:hypothetical protein